VYDENLKRSEFIVVDAKKIETEGEGALLGKVVLPQRVPYGFHGLWISEDKLDNQKELPASEH